MRTHHCPRACAEGDGRSTENAPPEKGDCAAGRHAHLHVSVFVLRMRTGPERSRPRRAPSGARLDLLAMAPRRSTPADIDVREDGRDRITIASRAIDAAASANSHIDMTISPFIPQIE